MKDDKLIIIDLRRQVTDLKQEVARLTNAVHVGKATHDELIKWRTGEYVFTSWKTNIMTPASGGGNNTGS